MIIKEDLSIDKKLEILSDAAKYDAACTSSGIDRKGVKGSIGSTKACGICHSFTPDGRCVSLLKILFTNECIFDCAYCINRSSNNTLRTMFTPEEVAELTVGFYRRNYIEGLFLSSGVIKSPDYTMEQIIKTLVLLREKYGFNGYIHCKAIPGASKEYVELAGWYADRMSVNLELPTAEALKTLAPHKNRKNILTPMRQIQNGIEQSRLKLGMKGGNYGAYKYTSMSLGRDNTLTSINNYNKSGSVSQTEIIKGDSIANNIIKDSNIKNNNNFHKTDNINRIDNVKLTSNLDFVNNANITKRGFTPGGQSSQIIIGASGETDFQIMSVSEALYSKFDLKRVFYSAFIRVNDDSRLPVLSGGVPLMREHRLYQADWLLRYYGFEVSELLNENTPNFNVFLDPKCDWAIRHLEKFPVEVSKADYYTLLKVPGIGVKSASRIIKIRKNTTLNFDILKRAGVVLKRAVYFITCNGKQYCPVKLEENFITSALLSNNDKDMKIKNISDGFSYTQLSLFDDKNFADANNCGVNLAGLYN